jgi:D-beta-D-heptose 7-phosphate kinase/D-beta-D-heptose 1-phosphate adenosyltransferase
LPELLGRLAPRRARGERLVLTNGCFDLLHLGHVRYLQEAAQLGELLIVALNSDASVGELKEPGRPLVPQQQRAEVLAALACVDFVTIFDEPTANRLVQLIRPNVYVKGGDYAGQPPPEAAVARAVGAEVRFLALVPGISTTDLIRRIRALPDRLERSGLP